MLGEPSWAAARPIIVPATTASAVADRDRTDADSDIEFDFFDEPPTIERSPVEPAPRPRESGGGGGTPPIRPRSPGAPTPLVRLALLIGGAIVLAVVLVFWVNSCRGGQKKGSYEDYMQAVAAVVRESDSVGTQLGELLTTPGVTLGDLETGLAGLAKQQAQVVARADELTPPGPLVSEQGSLVEAMQLRQSGLAGLERAFAQLQPATDPETAGTTLAEQAFRIVAGSVVYDDLFKGRSEQVMKQEEISGVAVPALDVPGEPGAPEPELARRARQAHAGRRQRHRRRAPRQPDRGRARPAGRPGALAGSGDDDHRLRPARVRGAGEELRRLPGDQGEGDADDHVPRADQSVRPRSIWSTPARRSRSRSGTSRISTSAAPTP